eukprot:c15565_g1_i2 orf=3-1637(-)
MAASVWFPMRPTLLGLTIALLIACFCRSHEGPSFRSPSSYSINLRNFKATASFLLLIMALLPLGFLFFVAWSCFTAQYWALIEARARVLLFRLPPLPPGSMGLPYWGETLEYMSSWLHPINPDCWFDTRHAKHGNTFRTFLLGTPTIVMLGPDANKFVLSNENRLFENNWPESLRALEGVNAVSMVHGETHARLRRALNFFLDKNTVSEFCGSIEGAVVRRINEDWLHAPNGSNMGNQNMLNILAFPALRKFTFQLNAELFMGLKPGPELERLQTQYENFTAGLESQPLDLPWTVFGKAKRARSVLLKYMLNKIESRRCELAEQIRCNGGAPAKARDLLDVLLMAKDEETGKLYTADEIGDNMLLLVHAGQDTTAAALATILLKLAQTPTILAELKSECRALADALRSGGEGGQARPVRREELKRIQLLRCVIREGLRLCPPVSGLFKRVKCDVVHDGYTIPKGWTVHLSARHSQLNSEYFPKPKVFDPQRFEKRYGNFSYIPFGQGARICPGMKFAIITMELFLYHLLSSIEEIQLVNLQERMI